MTHAALHQLVDEIPESQIERITELIRAVNANDRVGIALALAPEVATDPHEIALLDELTEEDRRNVSSIDDVCKRLGI